VSRRQPERGADEIAQRLRIHYARRGRLRFTSHRDVQRALERALRQARLPVAFSGGFNRHPKISYVGAAPTGAASEAEYLEISLTERVRPASVRADLDAALPAGLDILEVVEAGPGSLPDRVTGSRWRVELPGVEEEAAAAAIAAFLAETSVPVERVLKDGRRILDARAAVVWLELGGRGSDGDPGPCAILELVVRHCTPAVRPDDVLAGLREVAALTLPVPAKVTRLAQGALDPCGDLADPLATDRAAPAADGSPQPVAASAVVDRPPPAGA